MASSLFAQLWGTLVVTAYPFALGVASGDPAPDGFVLWTKIAPKPLKQRGGIPKWPIEVEWAVGSDARMRKVVQKGTTVAHPELGHAAMSRWAGFISSSLASCFEHGCFKCLTRARAGPGYKLERRVVLIACVDGSGQEHLALSTGRLDPTGKQECMTKHNETICGPELEMSEPHLRVDHRNEALDLGVASFWSFKVEGTSKMQRCHVMHPGECRLIVDPLPGHDDNEFILAGTLE
jgi:PhoD-like phosphatase